MAKKFVPFGLEKGSTGALGSWDVLGQGLDSANPFASTDDGTAEDAEAARLREQALDQWTGVNAPDLGPIDFEQYGYLGDLGAPYDIASHDVSYEDVDPRLADLTLADPSAFNDISVDPRLRDQQMGSLDALGDIVDAGGLTAADEANLSRIQNEVASEDRGRRDAIRADMQARGMGGSGMELLQMLDSSQDATNRANQSGLDIAGLAEQRALDAMVQGGTLAGSIRGQDFDQEAQVAAANDAINKFNATNSNANSQFNAGQTNNVALQNAGNGLTADIHNSSQAFDADKTNQGYYYDAATKSWQARQANSDKNTDVRNNAQVYNSTTIPQQNFDNATTVANGKSGAFTTAAAGQQSVADRKAKENAGQKGAITGVLGSTVGKMVSDERAKKDVQKLSDDEIGEFLSSIEPKRFRYKDPANGRGDRVGSMAQDLEGSSIGRSIVHADEDGTRSLDTNNLLGAILASIAHLHKKAG